MPATEIPVTEPEHERVERWRAEALQRAGYPREVAAELATRADVDLHQAVNLLLDGCPAETAARILL